MTETQKIYAWYAEQREKYGADKVDVKLSLSESGKNSSIEDVAEAFMRIVELDNAGVLPSITGSIDSYFRREANRAY